MPSRADHIELAIHDMEVAAHLLLTPAYCDWTATTAFYTAVHVVEAALFPRHSTDHVTREKILKNSRYQKIWEHFRPLKNASEVARYLEDRPGKTMLFKNYLSSDEVKQTLIMHHLNQIVKSASRLIGSNDLATKLRDEFTRTFQPPTN